MDHDSAIPNILRTHWISSLGLLLTSRNFCFLPSAVLRLRASLLTWTSMILGFRCFWECSLGQSAAFFGRKSVFRPLYCFDRKCSRWQPVWKEQILDCWLVPKNLDLANQSGHWACTPPPVWFQIPHPTSHWRNLTPCWAPEKSISSKNFAFGSGYFWSFPNIGLYFGFIRIQVWNPFRLNLIRLGILMILTCILHFADICQFRSMRPYSRQNSHDLALLAGPLLPIFQFS